MDIAIKKSKLLSGKTLQITGSKSESNRLLLLKALYPNIEINNLSDSDDTRLLQKALRSKSEIIDIHHAGTAMRFLTAFYAVKEGSEVILTGSHRMKERPIGILVDALKDLGADIQYTENQGFPPLRIKGKKLEGNSACLKANVSSQYSSALLLIAPSLENGLELELQGEITSLPYINMTLNLLSQIGVESSFKGSKISVLPKKQLSSKLVLEVESDWSSASYFYSLIALSAIGTKITLMSYKSNSLQGDSVLQDIYKLFGVETQFLQNGKGLTISKSTKITCKSTIELDLSNAPDIAQTIAVTAFGLGCPLKLKGLHTLKIKETDRLQALKNELMKLGAILDVTANSLELEAPVTINPNISITTYNDHRMAMAFAPLGLLTSIGIKDALVVSKSYPSFWQDLKEVGFDLK